MKNLKNKTKISALTFVLVLTFSAILVALPTVSAHDPPWNVPTYAYIYASPDPIGIGQTAVVIFWLDKVPPTAAGAGGDRWRNFELEITKPDGSKQTLGPYTSDPIGGAWTQYTPDQVGTYTFVLSFPGQVLSLYGPTGIPGRDNPYINDTYLASSATTTLTVQQEPIPEPTTYPLPTEYWTRPIEGQNTEWYRIASNWLGGSHIVGKAQPDGIAPNSPHIMWTKPISFGGVVGGSRTGIPGMTFYDGTAYESPFNPIIMYGRLYYTLPLSGSGSGGGYVCVDLLTGETLWENPDISPSVGQLYDYESPNQHGVIRNGYLWSLPGRGDPPDTPWKAYDPMTGAWLFSLANVSSGTEVYGPNGEILRYVLDSTGKWLALWNNTAAHGLTGARDPTDTTSSNYWQWRPLGKTVDMSQAYSWNVTIPWLPTGAAVVSVIHDDLILGRNGSLPTLTSQAPYTMWAISLKPETRGQLLWMRNYDAPAGNISRSVGPRFMGSLLDPESRVFLKYDGETIQWSGYSLDDGSLLWGPTPSEHSLNYYSDVGLTRYAVAYGNLYSTGYSGIVYCYNLKNGSLLWTYNSPTGLTAPWPNWPLGIGAIADGKVYLFTTEHSANAPHWRDVKMPCIDAFTGEEIWTVAGYGSQHGMAVADGYLIYLNLYDMQIYCTGKGPSATTVTAPDMGVPLGSSVTIRGRVIDKSAGTKQTEQAGRFPNGVPAISDEDQSEWMEYVYMQKPIPADAKGVEVTLDAVDPNGNWIHIGPVTSDMSGFYSYQWTPETEGKYTIIATFEGSKSYYSSYAETAVGVDPAPSPAEPIEPEPTEPAEAPFITTEVAILVAAVIVAIAVIVGFWIIRKRK